MSFETSYTMSELAIVAFMVALAVVPVAMFAKAQPPRRRA